MTTTLLQISGMTCQNCVEHVTKALKSIPHVKAAAVDLHAGRATVDHNGANEQKMLDAVSEEGYEAQVIPPSAEVNSAPVPPTQ